MAYSTAQLWTLIVLLGLGTFLVRFSFIGLVGDRKISPYLRRLLRFVPVAVMPGLVAPLVVWPQATGGAPDLPRMAAALAALVIGAYTRSLLGAVFGGMAVLYTALALM
ncbi:MAG: AzlD domain-containing protein [Pseudomonadota bacterium]